MESLSISQMENMVLNFWKTDRYMHDVSYFGILQLVADLRVMLGDASSNSQALSVHAAALKLNDLLKKEVSKSLEKRHGHAIMDALLELEEAAGGDVSDWEICKEAEERFAELVPA
jgi:hypothetical protein